MTWPGWGDILPIVGLLVGLAGSLAGLFWVLVRLFQPVAEKAARDAADGLYQQLKGNDFRHVEAGLKNLNGRLDRVDERIGTVRKEVGERFDRARQGRKDMEGRLIAAIAGKPLEGP